MAMFYLFRVLLLATVLLPAACNAMTATVAERCVLIDLQAQAGHELVPTLDAFAEQQGLVADKSHPISPSYERREGDRVIADVIYTMGAGKFGAELSLFRFDPKRNEDLLTAFDALVENEIKPRYDVTTCEEVEGYELPIVYR